MHRIQSHHVNRPGLKPLMSQCIPAKSKSPPNVSCQNQQVWKELPNFRPKPPTPVTSPAKAGQRVTELYHFQMIHYFPVCLSILLGKTVYYNPEFPKSVLIMIGFFFVESVCPLSLSNHILSPTQCIGTKNVYNENNHCSTTRMMALDSWIFPLILSLGFRFCMQEFPSSVLT